ncbi:MAG TPA: LysR family transcriptional regulator [Polyangiaceae bacterium]|jgi:DNA-binding transcriptional LysR family regulator|nr:LysR family transcriptional regulator [Polyangiaceae bacterium]
MPLEFDDLPTIAVFGRVVELRSFTLAAAELGLSKAAVSQRVARFEARLGVQLLRRSTRKLSLTEAGMQLFEHAVELAALTRAAESALSQGEAPRGRVKLNAPASIQRGLLARAMHGFLEQHPAVSLSVTLDDRLVDLVEGDYDVALRVLPASRLRAVSRKLGSDRVVVVGSPAYLARAPAIASPFDLIQHSCLRNSALPLRVDWRLDARRQSFSVPVRSRFESADFGLLHEAALAGVGLLVTLRMTVDSDLEAGRLVQVLGAYSAMPLGIHAIFAERGRPTSAARALVDHVARALREAGVAR